MLTYASSSVPLVVAVAAAAPRLTLTAVALGRAMIRAAHLTELRAAVAALE